MASIITATTTSGLTQSADNSGVLQLASGTGNLVTIPSVTGTAMVSGNMPAFAAYLSGSQTGVSRGTFTKVQFNTESFDTANAYDNTTNYRFTPQVAGYYNINAAITDVTGVSGAYQYGVIYKNGTYYCKALQMSGSNGVTSLVSNTVYLNGSTDYIEIYYYMSGAGTVGIDGSTGSGFNTWVNGFLVRTA